MMRLLTILLLILLLCSCVALAAEPKAPPNSSDTHQSERALLPLIFDGMTAIGTMLVALLAVFGQRIRSWIIRPVLSLAVGDKAPHAERIEEIEESASESKRISYQLRLEILNTGKEAARNCVVLCNKIYREKAGGTAFYILKEFVPLQFYWTTKNQTTDIVPELPSFLNIAEISVPNEPGLAGAVQTSPQGFTLQVQVEVEGAKGRFFRIDKGKIVVPVIIRADNLPRSIKQYIEICWHGGTEIDFTPEKFQIRVLSETKGSQLVGGA